MAHMPRHLRRKPPVQQQGLTLMEVLVAMLVMAFGLLGIAALQTTTLKYQLGSTQRSHIAMLLGDYAERVRANLAQAPGEVNASPYLLEAESWADMSSSALPSPTAQCTGTDAASRARCDMAQWRTSVRQLLPGGVAVVSGSASQGIQVTFAWRDKDFDDQLPECSADDTGMDAQFCCPAELEIPDVDGGGVRCANYMVMP